jgi:site-specific DNA-methyltransferase (adenine-specific)
MYSIEELKNYENQILNMDCIDFLKNCPDSYFDLCCCDPPYGIHNYITAKNASKNKGNKFACLYDEKQWDKERPNKTIFEEIFRISKNQIICGANYFVNFLPVSRGWIFWDKMGDKMTSVNNELIFTSFDKSIKTFRRCHGLDKGFMAKGINKVIHPTQKPIALIEWLLENYSNENDLILDCFSGSGTTAVACHNLKRRFICIEKDYDYWKASVERLKIVQAQQRLNLEF